MIHVDCVCLSCPACITPGSTRILRDRYQGGQGNAMAQFPAEGTQDINLLI